MSQGGVPYFVSTTEAETAADNAAVGAAAAPSSTRHDVEPEQRRRFARSLARMPRRARPPRSDVRDILEGQGTPVVLRRDSRVRRSLATADVLAAVVALGAALAIGGHAPEATAIAAPFFVVVLCKLGSLYDRDEVVIRKSTLDQAPALLQAATVYTLIFWLTSDFFVTGGIGKSAAATLWAVLALGLIVCRCIARRVAASTSTPERLLVLGSAEATERLQGRIDSAHSIHAILVGRVALERDDREKPRPLGPIDDLDYVLRTNGVERVIIAPSARTSDEQLDTIRLVKSLGVKVSVLPRLFEVVGSSMEFDDVDGITVLGLRRYGLPKTSWYVKRTFDIVGSTAGLLFAAPLLIGIALSVRLSSPGPVLFRQPRVGRGGHRFEMLKFRTMYDGADELKAELMEKSEVDGMFKIVDDPRVTPVGRLLRRTSLDELPQLINVLRGDMSLVGPRPLIEEEDRLIAGWHHRRREGTPGMTGVWQVLGSARVPLDDMVKMDYLYRANWSLWLDLKILLRTFAHVFHRRGA
jgi:exopolysaccharide biosynthesis polyprenyl glycosylphosphotransferase